MPRKKLTEEEEIARVKAMYEYEHNCRDNGYTAVSYTHLDVYKRQR